MGSVRLAPEFKEKIQMVATMKGLTVSDVHRVALEQYFEREMAPTRTSRYDDIIGVGEGASDLSSRVSEIFGEIMREKYDRHSD